MPDDRNAVFEISEIENEDANQVTPLPSYKRISFLSSLQLMLRGHTKIFELHGLEYHLLKCKVHGNVIDYVHGRNSYLACPRCMWGSKMKYN